MQNCQPQIFTAKRLLKMPNLSYLLFKNASWQPWLKTAADFYIGYVRDIFDIFDVFGILPRL